MPVDESPMLTKDLGEMKEVLVITEIFIFECALPYFISLYYQIVKDI